MSPLIKASLVLGLFVSCCPGWAQQSIVTKSTRSELSELGYLDQRLNSIQLSGATANCKGQQVTVKSVDGNRVQVTASPMQVSAKAGVTQSKICQIALKVRAPSRTAISLASAHLLAIGKTDAIDAGSDASQNRLLERLYYSFNRAPNLSKPTAANGTFTLASKAVTGEYNGLIDSYQTSPARVAPRSQCSDGNSQTIYLDLYLKATSGPSGTTASVSMSENGSPLVQEFLLGLTSCGSSVNPHPQPNPQPYPQPNPQPYPEPAPQCSRGDFCSAGRVIDWSCNCGYEPGGVDKGNGCYHIPTNRSCGGNQNPIPQPAPRCTTGDFCSSGSVVEWSCNCGYISGGVDQGNGCYHRPTSQSCGFQPRPEPRPEPRPQPRPDPTPAPQCSRGDFCSSGRVVDWACNCGYVSGGVDQGNGCYHVPTSQTCGAQPQPVPEPTPVPAPSCATGSFCSGGQTIDWSCNCGAPSGGVNQGNGCYHVPTGQSCN